jgi:SAM-dependent methyltransferase
MKTLAQWQKSLGHSYWVWSFYHAVVADAVSLQRPTKFRGVREYLDKDLGRVADVGCGPGVFLRYLCARATCVFALDVDTQTLERVKARHSDLRNLQLVASPVDHLPFPDGALDTVLFLEVLEHLTDDAGSLRELHRVLAPGGRLVLSVPIPPGEINPDDPWGHKREGYTASQIQELLESQHFVVQQHFFAQFKYSRLADGLIRNWRKWLKLPAPIFLSWVCYLDFLISPESRKRGDCLPACIVVQAIKS